MNASQRFRVTACSALLSWFTALTQAASAVLIWPVDPVIEADAKAVALWLENRGPEPVLMQLRIFSWVQADGENIYQAQTGVVGTPPMIEIAPGVRQLVRLTRTIPVPPGAERAYRVVVDEIPRAGAGNDPAAAGVRFQLRYSIPLFVYGEGMKSLQVAPRANDAGADGPRLAWRTVMHDGRAYLEVQNLGSIHARLTRAELRAGGVVVNMADGLLGYVLPGATMRWPLPREVTSPAVFIAAINGVTTAEPVPAVP